MSFATTMTALKDKVDGLIANRVAKFAYTQQAYNSDDVNGVTTYDFNNEQNVPTSSASVLKVNETVLTKGWRTQASAITRMLMNHFLGRTSYNLNKTVDFLKAFMLAIENNMGVAEGFATLDENTQLPLAQLTPDVIIDCGEWDADTNTPELEIGEGRKGDTYRVSVAGTQDLGEGLVTYRIGDTIMYNGSVWVKTASGTVSSVNTVTPDDAGNVTITGEDISTSSSDLTSIKNKMIEYAKLSFTPLLGRAWFSTKRGTQSFRNFWGKVYYINGYYYTCANFGSSTTSGVYKSIDGLNWEATNVTWGNVGGTSGYMYFIKHSPTDTTPNRFIIGTNKGLLYSDDYFNTYTWSNIRTGAYMNAPTDITELGIIATNKANEIPIYSEDNGETWQVSTFTVNGSILGMGKILLQINNRLLICAKLQINTIEIYALCYSADCGVNWERCLLDQSYGEQVYFASHDELTVRLIDKSIYAFALNANQTGMWYCSLASFRFFRISGNPMNVEVNDIIQANKNLIAITASGIKYGETSTWTNSNITSGNYTQLAYANGIALACIGSGTSTKLKYSTDSGVTWTDCNIPSNSPYVISGYFNGVWLVYADAQNKPVNYYSTDGVNFILVDSTPYITGMSAKVQELQLVHGVLFGKNDYNNVEGKTYISSVDTLIERGWVNID